MKPGLAAAAAVAILFLISSCGDRTSGTAANEEMMDQSLSAASRAQLDACLAQAVTSPWRVVHTQPFVKHLSVTLEATSDALGLPHRPIHLRRQQYVVLAIGRSNLFTFPSSADVESRLASGIFKPSSEVAGIAAPEFAPFVPYANGETTEFLNVSGRERCRYRARDAELPNPFVSCKARLGEYTAGFAFPHDAIAHLPRLFDDIRPLLNRVTACFDLTKEQ